MRIFGLTGGIASGKSTVAKRFALCGVPVVDADELARQAVEKGSAGLASVVERFGPQVLDEQGNLDRKRLGALVFGKPAELAALNAIIHPRVAALSAESFARLRESGVPLACYEVPLLIENGLHHAFRPVVLVATDPETQRSRIQVRDGLSSEQAELRIAAQLPLAEKLAVADYVVENSGSVEDLLSRADQVLAAIRAQEAAKA